MRELERLEQRILGSAATYLVLYVDLRAVHDEERSDVRVTLLAGVGERRVACLQTPNEQRMSAQFSQLGKNVSSVRQRLAFTASIVWEFTISQSVGRHVLRRVRFWKIVRCSAPAGSGFRFG